MYYAPSRPIEIEKFPKGYIKPTGQNLEYLQRPPEDNRRIQDYYGKAQDLPNYQDKPFTRDKIYGNGNQVQTQGSQEEQQQIPNEKLQENKQKDNQNPISNIRPQSTISPGQYQSLPYNTIFTDDNIYRAVDVPQNFSQSAVQPLESRINPTYFRDPQREHIHGFRGVSQDFQGTGLDYYPQDFRDIYSEDLRLPLKEYRRMAPPGLLSEYRRGIPEPILSRRSYGRDLRKDYSYRVFPVRDYKQMNGVYEGAPIIVNHRNFLPQEQVWDPYIDYQRQRFEPQIEQRMYYDHRSVPVPDYYVPEYRGFGEMGRQRELDMKFQQYRNQPYYQNMGYPPSYGRVEQQISLDERQGLNMGRDYYEQGRRNDLNERIKYG